MPATRFSIHVSHPDLLVHAECQVAIELSGLEAGVRPLDDMVSDGQIADGFIAEDRDVIVAGPGARAVQAGRLFLRRAKCKPGPRAIAVLAPGDLASLAPLVRTGYRGFVLDDRVAKDIVPAIMAIGSGGAYLSADLLRALVDPASRKAAVPSAQGLTPREQEILSMIAIGLSNKDVARRLDLSVRTVETHRLNIRKKTAARDRRDLIRVAQRLGLFAAALAEPYDIVGAAPAAGFHEE